MDIKELETADYDLLENIKAAFRQLWKLKLVLVLSALIGLLSFFVILSIKGNQTVYRSTAGIYSAMYGAYKESSDGVKVMNTYASMLGTSRVCERAAGTLGDPNLTAADLSRMVRSGEIYLAGASSNSRDYGYRLTLVVATDSPKRIADVANAVAQAFADEINDFLGVSTLQVLDPATTYHASKIIDTRLYTVLFPLAGFFLAAVVIFIKEFFSSKVRTIGQCEKEQQFILGMVPCRNQE